MNAATFLNNLQDVARTGLGAPLLVITMLAMMVLPLPAFLLDVFFTFNIAFALVVLLVAVYMVRALDFAVFPTVILVATLLRLSLNVASTRVVLLEGHEGTNAAGRVIEAFGEFVIGGNFAVGLVVFAVLIIINFVVVTKGAGRIAEVNARFTLDAMPGKQMAIDADLNAGMITQEEAQERRTETRREADFFGAMDGSSKFVRGDATAGIFILLINIVGGLAIGMGQHGMAFSDAIRNYTLLTIGDGLVAQIPSLVLSTAAAIIVTRVSGEADQAIGTQVMHQLFDKPQALAVTAAIIGSLGLVPGMPNFIFLTLAGLAAWGAWAIYRKQQAQPVSAAGEGGEEAQQEAAPSAEARELSWSDVGQVDIIGLEVGFRLIPLVDRNQDGQLMSRIKGVRKKLSQELGFLVQPVHIRDNLDLAPNAYRISLHGVTMGEAEVFPDQDLAINPGQVYGELKGTATKDPTFGLEAVWIDVSQRDQAQTLGYTVVDASTVIATHLSQVLQDHADELLGHDEVQQLLDRLATAQPKLVENLVPQTMSLGAILKVLQNLLAEQVPIRDMRTIAESLAEQGGRSQDPGTLTAGVRVALARSIMQQIAGNISEVPLITLDPALEQLLHKSTQGSVAPTLEPGLAERLQKSLADAASRQEMQGQPAILVVAPELRAWLARWLRANLSNLAVLSYNEIPDNRRIRVVATIGQKDVSGRA